MPDFPMTQALGGVPPSPAAPGSPGPAAGLYGGDTDPALAAFMQQNNLKDPTIAKMAMENLRGGPPGGSVKPGSMMPQSPVDPYMNFANKATGQPSK